MEKKLWDYTDNRWLKPGDEVVDFKGATRVIEEIWEGQVRFEDRTWYYPPGMINAQFRLDPTEDTRIFQFYMELNEEVSKGEHVLLGVGTLEEGLAIDSNLEEQWDNWQSALYNYSMGPEDSELPKVSEAVEHYEGSEILAMLGDEVIYHLVDAWEDTTTETYPNQIPVDPPIKVVVREDSNLSNAGRVLFVKGYLPTGYKGGGIACSIPGDPDATLWISWEDVRPFTDGDY